MLSVLIYGRNDVYGGMAQRRSALSINALAEVLADEDEIIFVDYNTEDHKLTFIEAIDDTLTARAQRLLRVIRVRPEQHARLSSSSALPVIEAVARNIGLRHSNPDSRWVLSTNPDVILLPPVEGLHALLRSLDDGYYAAPRFELPRMLWQRLPRHDPAAVHEAIARFSASLHLDEEVHHYLPTVGYDAPGDFQLALRRDLVELGGFEEAMQHAWHVDSNLMARLGLKYGAPRSLAGRVRVYHCEHTADTVAKHSAGRSEDSFDSFVANVQTSFANPGKLWGGEGLAFENARLAELSGLDTADVVAAIIGTPQSAPYQAVYGPESFAKVPRNDTHTLPFVIDRVFAFARSTRMVWIGSDTALRSQVGQVLERIGFVHPLAGPDERGALVTADLVLLDNPSSGAPDEDVALLERQIEALIAVEIERIEAGRPARQIIAINAVHCDLEALLLGLFDLVLCPFTTRLRPALVRPAETNTGSWLGDLSVGAAGERLAESGAIALRRGSAGHVFFGPYHKLHVGRYRACVSGVQEPGRPGKTVLEVVQGETMLAQSNCALDGAGPIDQKIEFTILGSSYLVEDSMIQIRFWTDGQAGGMITTVEVERL
jgi:hypothetical protein